MASNFKLGTTSRNAAASALAALLDGGRIEIRTGAPPANVSDASTPPLLGSPTFANPAFGAPAIGVVTANPIVADTAADNSGVAGHFRGYASGAADVAAEWQGTAGEAADTPDMVFNNKTIVAGGTIAISALTMTVPIQ